MPGTQLRTTRREQYWVLRRPNYTGRSISYQCAVSMYCGILDLKSTGFEKKRNYSNRQCYKWSSIDSLFSQTATRTPTEWDIITVHHRVVVPKPALRDEFKWLLVDGGICVHEVRGHANRYLKRRTVSIGWNAKRSRRRAYTDGDGPLLILDRDIRWAVGKIVHHAIT